ncbi:MAG: prepilin-type N-terminal cleavage/methylation domain-containing protein [Oscillospiraceae bacterium]|nr:prepilin-type N-terminal cleavage/methylation domain-containing protein [Oscillospiraceae bacterium]
MKSRPEKKKFKGFTLVEVMTSLVIMTILISVASGVIIVTFDIFGRSALKRAAQDNGNNVYNYIYDHLSYATALKIDQTVDINNKEKIESVMTELGYTDMEDVITEITNNNGEVIKTDIKPYYEKITIDKQHMIVERKDINAEVYIYGNAENENTMNGCDCIVEFDKYDAGDTIEFTVKIERYNEVFYEKHGSVPLLNKEIDPDLVNHIKVGKIKSYSEADETDGTNGTDGIEIFYTYIW